MTKTTYYQLPQWEASDPVRRGDFNQAMGAIDAGIAAAQTAAEGAQTAAEGAQTTANTARTEAGAAQTAANAASTAAQAAQTTADGKARVVLGTVTLTAGTNTIYCETGLQVAMLWSPQSTAGIAACDGRRGQLFLNSSDTACTISALSYQVTLVLPAGTADTTFYYAFLY